MNIQLGILKQLETERYDNIRTKKGLAQWNTFIVIKEEALLVNLCKADYTRA